MVGANRLSLHCSVATCREEHSPPYWDDVTNRLWLHCCGVSTVPATAICFADYGRVACWCSNCCQCRLLLSAGDPWASSPLGLSALWISVVASGCNLLLACALQGRSQAVGSQQALGQTTVRPQNNSTKVSLR